MSQDRPHGDHDDAPQSTTPRRDPRRLPFWNRFADLGFKAERERHAYLVSIVIVAAVTLVLILIGVTIAIGRVSVWEQESHGREASPSSVETSPSSPISYFSPTPTTTRYTPLPLMTPTATPEPVVTQPPTPSAEPSETQELRLLYEDDDYYYYYAEPSPEGEQSSQNI